MTRSEVRRPSPARIPATWALALAFVALGLSATAASAAASLSAPQGATITISGMVSPSGACPGGVPVQLTSAPASGTTNLFPNGLGPQVPRDATGNFKATFTIPAATPVGSYTIGVRCNGAAALANQTLMVTAAAQAPPAINVSVGAARPGDGVTITGVVPATGAASCPAGDAAQLTSTAGLFPPDGFGPQLPRDASGSFHGTFTIPKTTPLGTYSIGVRCGGGTVGITATLQVAATVPTSTTSTTTAASTTTTTKAPATTTTAKTTTTLALATTVPAGASAGTTTTTLVHHTSKSSSTLRWVGLAVLAVVLVIAAVVYRGRRTPSAGPRSPVYPPE